MQLSSYRTVCEKCGRVTVTKLLSDVQALVRQEETGQMIFLMLCPEHKAEWLRLISDFLDDVEEIPASV